MTFLLLVGLIVGIAVFLTWLVWKRPTHKRIIALVWWAAGFAVYAIVCITFDPALAALFDFLWLPAVF